MKLCIKQKVLSFNDKFNVMNEYGEVLYTVEGQLFSFGRKLHLYNNCGTEVAFIAEKVFSFLPQYTISIQGEPDVIIKKEFTLFEQLYTVYGKNWEIKGNIFAHRYNIVHKNGTIVAKIDKEYFSFGDCYTLEIFDPQNTLLCLASVLAIDCVLDRNNHNN